MSRRRAFSRKYIDQQLGQIVLVRPEQPVERHQCMNIGRWYGNRCMMTAEEGTDRCKLHPHTD